MSTYNKGKGLVNVQPDTLLEVSTDGSSKGREDSKCKGLLFSADRVVDGLEGYLLRDCINTVF